MAIISSGMSNYDRVQNVAVADCVPPPTTPNSKLPTQNFPEMVGSSSAMRRVRSLLVRIARTPETVLITGESGTGKELVARALHAMSNRKTGAWVTLNCPALSAQLLESELFGHKKGAFTGADYDRIGRFESANGGSLLLDEISEIDISLQSKLLRVLQERSFERVGSSETIAVDVRVIATTNRDLLGEMNAGKFREDLFYRLAVLPIEIPPLRTRREDIPELVTHFSVKASEKLSREPLVFDDGAINLLCEYHWPGNVRQLENLVTRAHIFCDCEQAHADDLRDWLFEHSGMRSQSQATNDATEHTPRLKCNDTSRLISAKFSPQRGIVDWEETELPPESESKPDANDDFGIFSAIGMTLAELERRHIEQTLQQFNGHRTNTAKALGIGLRTLTTKLKQFAEEPSVL